MVAARAPGGKEPDRAAGAETGHEMRWSRYHLVTRRDAPAGADAAVHPLLLRAGALRRLAGGGVAYLPLGRRSLARLEALLRRELAAAGALEVASPVGRTAPEALADVVRGRVTSYRQLPLHLFRLGAEVHAEARRGSAPARTRERHVAAGCAFHADRERLEAACRGVAAAYRSVLAACGVEVLEAASDGGRGVAFVAPADAGPDEVLRDPATGGAATVDTAACAPLPEPPPSDLDQREAPEEVATPDAHTVAAVAELLGVDPRRIVKTLLYETDRGPVAALVRGDREVDEAKLARAVGAARLELAGPDEVRRATGAPVGFAGPVGLPEEVLLVADRSLEGLGAFVCGANRADAHLVGVRPGRDFPVPVVHDLLRVRAGDPSPGGDRRLEAVRGVEVARVTGVDAAAPAAAPVAGCTYADEEGAERPMAVGSHELDLGRVLTAAVEAGRDEAGIVWPPALAPFEVLVVALGPAGGGAGVAAEAERIYRELRERGAEVLYDDRDERPGAKFHDADLLGVPVRVVVGGRSLAAGQVELSHRRDREKLAVPRGDAVARALALLES